MAIEDIKAALDQSGDAIAKATVQLETRLSPQGIAVLHRLIELAILHGEATQQLAVARKQ